MERHLIDGIRCRIVMLDGLLTPDVKNLNHFVGAATRDACAIRVELNGTNSFVMVVEGANVRFRGHVPELAGCVFGA